MKISANGIDVAEVQAQQLAADQAVVSAETANIKKGSTVLGQAGTYTQGFYVDGVSDIEWTMTGLRCLVWLWIILSAKISRKRYDLPKSVTVIFSTIRRTRYL